MRPCYRFFSTLTLLLAVLVLPGMATAQTILNLTSDGAFGDHNGARFIQEDASEGAGTGLLDPFYRVKSNLAVVAGVNTANATVQFQTEAGPWTTALLLSTITDREIPGFGVFKEFILDINQTSGSRIYPLNDVQIWSDNQTDLNCYNPDPTASGHSPIGGGQWGTCDTGLAAIPIFWLDRDFGGGFPGTTGNATVILDYDLESGSGNQTDMTMLIPLSAFPLGANCQYGSSNCDRYVYVYSQFGKANECGGFTKSAGNKTYACSGNDDGFEEWSTLVEPFVRIAKTLSGSVNETHDWTITKDVDKTVCDQFIGGSCTFNYTVQVNETENFFATIGGAVTYSVPAKLPDNDENAPNAVVTVVSDVFSDTDGTVVFADPTCAPGQQFTVNAGSSKTCNYTVTFASPSLATPGPQTNTVTATVALSEAVFTAVANATIASIVTGPPTINVTDTFAGPLGTTSSSATYPYPRPYICSSNPNDYSSGKYTATLNNTATIVENGRNDSETVTVNCYAPVVSKNATASYTRTYTWDITKGVAPAVHNLFIGQSANSNYVVNVDQTVVESAHAIAGAITVQNPNPGAPMTVAVADVLDDGTPVNLACGNSLNVPANSSANCNYTAAPPNASATLNTATVTLNGVGFNATAPVSFSVNTVGFPTVNVTDTIQGALGSASGDQSFPYTRPFPCSSNPADYSNGMYSYTVNNTATIVETNQSDSELVTVNCYAPVVTKTATGAFATTIRWTIDKAVSPSSLSMFNGDTGQVQYTITVDKTVTEDGYSVTGAIQVANPNPFAPMNVSVADVLNDGTPVQLACAGALVVPAGGVAPCLYSAIPLDGSATLNTATVTFNAIQFVATAPVSFVSAPSVGEESITVTDNYGSQDTADDLHFGPFGNDDQVTYTRTFACGSDAGDHINTARIDQTGDGDSATVTVNCYSLQVTKNATTTFDREYDWLIDKTADQTELTLAIGEPFQVNYQVEVKVNPAYVDFNHAVSGQITVSNTGNPIAAVINGVSDLISGPIVGTVDCPVAFPHTLAAGGQLVCTYSANLPDGASRQNSATATQQNHNYLLAGTVAGGTTDYLGTAPVTFGEPTQVLDACTDVTDSIAGPLGTVCLAQSPRLFPYPYTITPTAEQCGEFRVDNVASHVESNTGETGSDSWSILVIVPCPEGCTLTQGYWKTHNVSFKGGAPPDDNWLNIPPSAETSPFFLSGQTWFQVFWTAPKGNVYYNLAHQWMAAYLNTLNDAGAPPDVATAIANGASWFGTYTPAQLVAPTGNAKKTAQGIATLALIEQFRAAAGVLGSYNEGLIGPGHCDEDRTSAPARVAGSVDEALELDGLTVGSVEEAAALASSTEQSVALEAPAVEIPASFAVGNYPNPFNPTTTIQVAVPEASHVRVAVYDLLGRMVTMLVDGDLSAGTHRVTFDAGSLPSGVYLYRMEYSGGAITKTMQLLK